MTALWSSPERRSERCAACADEQGVGRQTPFRYGRSPIIGPPAAFPPFSSIPVMM